MKKILILILTLISMNAYADQCASSYKGHHFTKINLVHGLIRCIYQYGPDFFEKEVYMIEGNYKPSNPSVWHEDYLGGISCYGNDGCSFYPE